MPVGQATNNGTAPVWSPDQQQITVQACYILANACSRSAISAEGSSSPVYSRIIR